ncbi:hypothetical protein Glove_50g45 [Diversispora epigaea]|uniref:BTB domain-containing protein n=1 Tax=Diversispora epigaea TaxID=1348612 RepID=A0A397JI91_9GLOM|nr:hypothetical protein Glove_50g45 [Diversispora epigaea]
MTLKFFDKLSQNFIELLNDEDDYNVIIEVKNQEKYFTAHSNILKYRSPYFRREIGNIHPNENNIKTITESSVSAQIFETILKYIYGGIVDLENVQTRFIFDLMLAANQFGLEELNKTLETYLIDIKASWLKEHCSFVYRTIFRKNFKKLEKFCNNIIVRYPNIIFDADDFTSLPESSLISLLKRDYLQMEEVKIWDYVIKWGIAQNPDLPISLDEFTQENFLRLKTTLQQCLPNIRYFHLSANEVRDSIRPYKKILDKQLWKDIDQHLLFPHRPVKSIILPARSVLVIELPPRIEEPRGPFSVIISEEHAAEISTWIDRETTLYTSQNYPYKFELILRGSIDGFAPQTFWDICHGHANTVVLAKDKESDEIFGGYNPLAWDNSNIVSSKWMKTYDSFVFSLKNGNIQNSILSRVKDPKRAIRSVRECDQVKIGPYFGYDFIMQSLTYCNFTIDHHCHCSYFGGNFYGKPIRTSSSGKDFSIENYEVFKIVRKS